MIQSMKKSGFWISFVFNLLPFGLAIDIVYLDQACNSTVEIANSHVLESDTSLTYSPLQSCYYTVSAPTAPTGSKILLIVRRFELEYEANNACVDFVDIHDGSNLSSTKLNPTALCGDSADSNYTSTNNAITVYFQTDGTGQRTGFDFLFVVFSTGACSSSQFTCNSSMCIDESLVCNIYSECGDESDETGCTSMEPPGVQINDKTGLIVGATLGGFVFIIMLVVLGYYLYRNYRWKYFLRKPITAQEYVNEATNFTTAYPVTKLYYRERYQQYYKTPEMPSMFPGETKIGISQQQRETTKIMKNPGKGEEAVDPSSSSSQDPEWKTWEKTEQI